MSQEIVSGTPGAEKAKLVERTIPLSIVSGAEAREATINALIEASVSSIMQGAMNKGCHGGSHNGSCHSGNHNSGPIK